MLNNKQVIHVSVCQYWQVQKKKKKKNTDLYSIWKKWWGCVRLTLLKRISDKCVHNVTRIKKRRCQNRSQTILAQCTTSYISRGLLLILLLACMHSTAYLKYPSGELPHICKHTSNHPQPDLRSQQVPLYSVLNSQSNSALNPTPRE